MKMVYQWKMKYVDCDPQVAGEYIETLKQNSPRLTSEVIVEDATNNPKTCPYYGHFEWDDSVAAHKHRCRQANDILHCLNVTVQHDESSEISAPIRAYISLGEGRDSGGRLSGSETMESIVEVMSDEDKRRMLMSKALGELNSWRLRYQALAEFAKLFTFIDALTAKLGDKIGYVQHADRETDGELQEVRGDD